MNQNWKPISNVAKIVYAAGFNYDPEQDIIYSRQDALQRKTGYAYGYDVLAPCTISAKIDCEPFFITYKDNDWMIEFWKGQYGIETGCELGIYIRPHNLTKREQEIYPILDKIIGRRPYDPNPEHGRFFRCPTDEELEAFGAMSLVLNKKSAGSGSQIVFERKAIRDWWLTGFKWGVFSEPEELTVDVKLEFSETAMCDVFVSEWKEVYASQKDKKINVSANTISFTYDKPATPQPWNNPGWIGFVKEVQKLNQKMVTIYNEMGFVSNDPNNMICDQEELMRLLDLMTTSNQREELFENVSKGLKIAEEYYQSEVVVSLKRYECSAENVGMILKNYFKLKYEAAAVLMHKYGFNAIHVALVLHNVYKEDKEITVKTIMSLYKCSKSSLENLLEKLDFDREEILKETEKYF